MDVLEREGTGVWSFFFRGKDWKLKKNHWLRSDYKYAADFEAVRRKKTQDSKNTASISSNSKVHFQIHLQGFKLRPPPPPNHFTLTTSPPSKRNGFKYPKETKALDISTHSSASFNATAHSGSLITFPIVSTFGSIYSMKQSKSAICQVGATAWTCGFIASFRVEGVMNLLVVSERVMKGGEGKRDERVSRILFHVF